MLHPGTMFPQHIPMITAINDNPLIEVLSHISQFFHNLSEKSIHSLYFSIICGYCTTDLAVVNLYPFPNLVPSQIGMIGDRLIQVGLNPVEIIPEFFFVTHIRIMGQPETHFEKQRPMGIRVVIVGIIEILINHIQGAQRVVFINHGVRIPPHPGPLDLLRPRPPHRFDLVFLEFLGDLVGNKTVPYARVMPYAQGPPLVLVYAFVMKLATYNGPVGVSGEPIRESERKRLDVIPV
jgi:hypothetical protein